MRFRDNFGNREYFIPRTQKATGVMVLRDNEWRVPAAALIQSVDGIDSAWTNINYYARRSISGYDRYGTNSKLFARPCPVRPRHGFVDSQVVTSAAATKLVFEQAQAADPEAELLLMPVIDADYSAIWTPGRLVIGPGHDGATSGHDSFSIPLVNNNGYSWGQQTLSENAKIKSPDVPYIEVVHERGSSHPYYVQIRGGPALATSFGEDYIPNEMTVEHVVKARGDLLEWEAQTAQFQTNTAVWHPGGSLASHYAVHCVLHNIPILISKRPRIGDKLVPDTSRQPINYDAVLDGIGAGSVLSLTEHNLRRPAVAAMLTGLHNLAAFSGDDGFWLGASAVLMHRLGSVALLGEARHASNSRLMDRDQIYDAGLNTIFQTRRGLRRAQWLFTNYPWGGRSYGGKAWVACGDALLNLDQTIRLFVRTPNESGYKKMVASLNEAVNQAHNGGWWLNKFCEEELMNQAAGGDPRAVADGLNVLAELHCQRKSDNATMAVTLWAATRAIPGVEYEAQLGGDSACSWCGHNDFNHIGGVGQCNICPCPHFNHTGSITCTCHTKLLSSKASGSSSSMPGYKDVCHCGHDYGKHTNGMKGKCNGTYTTPCTCKHWNHTPFIHCTCQNELGIFDVKPSQEFDHDDIKLLKEFEQDEQVVEVTESGSVQVHSAQGKMDGGLVHVQFKPGVPGADYQTKNLPTKGITAVHKEICKKTVAECLASGTPRTSYALTTTPYYALNTLTGPTGAVFVELNCGVVLDKLVNVPLPF